jgi:(1->4)-alpha-D-glucan 1-alpha-D-glucosylmutase
MGDGLIDRQSAATRDPAVQRITPRATYRIQLRRDFPLEAVRALVPYLRSLGVSDLYLSPLFRAREESSHGYDVVDHGAIDPAFGDLADFQRLAETVRESGMGILLDIVPNHMGINDAANKWWNDVLEFGEASQYATYFDIDWLPAASHLRHKVLLPFLGATFGETLESGQLRAIVVDGKLQLAYADKRFPLARATWPDELARALAASPRDEKAIAALLQDLNGREGDPKSFDALEALLDAQSYRLAYWRVASDEINYRRFFDINDLAAIRVEEPRVFDEVHRLVGKFLAEGWVTGLRIDHPDGLLDPAGYFAQLQTFAQQARGSQGEGDVYIVAEKILEGDEQLPSDWAVSGTTGYDFMNMVNRLFVNGEGLAAIRENYARVTGEDDTPAQIGYDSKREVLRNALASELNVLAGQLDRIARQHRGSRDFTRSALTRALREFIACLPVYRTYVRPQGWEIGDDDFRNINAAIRWAKLRNAGASHAELDFLASVLRLENPATLTREQADERRRFALKVQQVAGPAMAKGLEDTAFYRYYPLASLNEVGAELGAGALDASEFHRLMTRRAGEWPHTMSATATHDTKRGEDLRARLHVLSEVADAWLAAVERWLHLTRSMLVEVEGQPAPCRNDLYLLFQTLVGIWPAKAPSAGERDALQTRITAYMQKALREAKRHSSWVNPGVAYEEAVAQFVRAILTDARAAAVRNDIANFAARISTAGYVNGLAQVLLKAFLPGVPDFYQGCEYWDFHLVDPDNRQPVDFAARERSLSELQRRFAAEPASLASELASDLSADAAKQFLTWRALQVRLAHADVCARGEYLPLPITGARADHAFAFARHFEGQWIAAIVPLQIECLGRSSSGHPSQVDWQDTVVELPEGVVAWQDELTGATTPITRAARLSTLLSQFPVALLTSSSLLRS